MFLVKNKQGKYEVVFTPHDGSPVQNFEVFDFKQPGGIGLAM